MVVGCCCLVTKSCLTLCDLMDHKLPWDPPVKNTGVDCQALLRGIFLTQDQTHNSYISCIGRRVLYHLCPLGSPNIFFFPIFSSFLYFVNMFMEVQKLKNKLILGAYFLKKYASFKNLSIWSDILRFSVFCPKKILYILNKHLNKFTRDCYMKYPKMSHSDKSLSVCVYIWTYPMITAKHSDKTKLFWCLLIWKHLAHRNSPGFMSRMSLPLLLFSNCIPPSQI